MMNSEVLKKRLIGVHAYPITPFSIEDKVNVKGLKENIRFLINNNIPVIVPIGGTGEYDSLDQCEKKLIIKLVLTESKGGNCTVICPTGGNLKESVELVHYIEELGGEVIIIRPPKVRTSYLGLYKYYEKIITQTNLAVVIHRLPNSDLPNELIKDLTNIKNVISIKDEVEDIEWFRNTINQVGGKIIFICGGVAGGEVMAPFYYMLGARALTSGIANFIPEFPLYLHELLMKKEFTAALEIVKKIAPIQELRARMNSTKSIPVIKAALDLLGMSGGSVRLPLLPLSFNEKIELKKILIDLGITIK